MLGCTFSEGLGNRPTDSKTDDTICIDRGRRLPRPDGPDRLVGKHARRDLILIKPCECGSDLPAHECLCLTRLFLGQVFTDTDDRRQSMVECSLNLLMDRFVTLPRPANRPPFGVPDDHILAQCGDHRSGDIPRMRARFLPVDILCS